LRSARLHALQWLPALTALAYVVTVAVLSRGLVHGLFWDPDVAGPFVLGERLRGHGPVYIPHYGQWTLLWSLLATRDLPGHATLWEALGYPFAVAGAALVGWAAWRVAGRWAGATAAAVALVVGPFALRSQLSAVYHVTTPFTAALLGAYLVQLARRAPAGGVRRRSLALALLVGVIAGTNAASDALLWPAGIAPFAVASVVLLSATRSKQIAIRAGLALAATVTSALVTIGLMRFLDFHVVGLDVHPVHLSGLAANVRQLGRMVALLAGANYALPGAYPPEPLRIVLALLAVAALAACVVAAFRHFRRGSEPVVRAYACYWAAAVVFLAVTFTATTNAVSLGAGSVNYLLTFPLAAGAGAALLASDSRRARVGVAAAVAVVGATNIAGIVAGHADTPRGAIGKYERPVVRRLEESGATHGYAGYWDAHNLTWQSGMRVLAAPVSACGSTLCGHTFTTIASWYEKQHQRSFLIADASNAFVPPSSVVHDASASYRFGPLTIYVFEYGLPRSIRPPQP
jgi:hypothetical protein